MTPEDLENSLRGINENLASTLGHIDDIRESSSEIIRRMTELEARVLELETRRAPRPVVVRRMTREEIAARDAERDARTSGGED
jgi:hypothetical protein